MPKITRVGEDAGKVWCHLEKFPHFGARPNIFRVFSLFWTAIPIACISNEKKSDRALVISYSHNILHSNDTHKIWQPDGVRFRHSISFERFFCINCFSFFLSFHSHNFSLNVSRVFVYLHFLLISVCFCREYCQYTQCTSD